MPDRPAPLACPACTLVVLDLPALARHLVDDAERSDDRHVMWLNRHVTKHRVPPAELERLLAQELAGDGSSGERVAR